MDAFSSIVAVVMATVVSVSVGSMVEGQCLEYPYEVVTIGLHGAGTNDVRGVPKRHNADVGGGRRRRMRTGFSETYIDTTTQAQTTSYKR
ncbi:hypothetical protein F4777DRAFT_576144 [Nemania sp. FL0916]|nr:hypothetical protein F4777DRAFT_576144 [Nemania sp. FL0916]